MKELIYHRQFLPALKTFGSKTAVIDGSYQASFEAHGERVLRLANAMPKELGISPGDRFAVMAVNCHEYLELYHAAFLGAGVINPLNLRLAGQELEYIVRDSGTEIIFVDQHFAQIFHDAMAESTETNPIRQVVLIGDGEGPCDVRYEELLEAGESVVPAEPEEEDPVVLMYTGGTTGLPKGVLVTQRAEILNCYHAGIVLGRFDSREVSLIQTPIFHAASMVSLLATTGAGGAQVLIPMFEPGGVIELIEQHRVTLTMMVPTMIAMMVNHPEFTPERIQSLESLTYGASPMPAVLLDRLLDMLPDLELNQGYGMTECSSILTFLGPDNHKSGDPKLRSVGRPVPGVELSIQNEAGEMLNAGETGEVCAKGGNFMTEYWRKPEATAEAFDGGWYHTGDAGYLDEEGFLFLVDRVKDMIITGGENVYSVEVENAISSHAAVEQVAVIGIPHELWGEQVHAVVVRTADVVVTEEEIIEHARATIAGYKVPKSVEFRDEPLPLSGALKVLKRALRDPYWKDQDVSI
jgi:acyl-CoA synthetase (AMP-forming)/AMP-acid ligase II